MWHSLILDWTHVYIEAALSFIPRIIDDEAMQRFVELLCAQRSKKKRIISWDRLVMVEVKHAHATDRWLFMVWKMTFLQQQRELCKYNTKEIMYATWEKIKEFHHPISFFHRLSSALFTHIWNNILCLRYFSSFKKFSADNIWFALLVECMCHKSKPGYYL